MLKEGRGRANRLQADHEQLYRRFLERNPEFDGEFLTGVVSTGVYCLPSCPARRPKPENVRFFETPEEARRAGLRPCRRCRPDALYRGEAWHENIFERTAERVCGEPAAFPDIAAISRTAGLSRTALNLLFLEHAHETAGTFLRRARIAKARQALAGGRTPLRAAADSGFESASAFHAQFLARTGVTPAAYARLQAAFTVRLPSRYRTDEVLDFQGRDSQGLSESITPCGFRKCVLIGNNSAVIDICFESGTAVCSTDAVDVRTAHEIAVRMLGFDCEPSLFERQHAADPIFGALIQRQAGLRVPLAVNAWESLAWSIIGQQISLQAAVRLRRAMIATFGTPHASGMVAHPAPEVIAGLDPAALVRLRFPAFKADYLIAAARALASSSIRLSRQWSAMHIAREMKKVRGIGPWTIQYSLLRGVGLADCLPASDAGVIRAWKKVAPDTPSVADFMARFAPFRSLATYHLWQSLKGADE